MSTIKLPEEVLQKMTCQSCKNFLSVFPVHIKKDNSDTALCGRCKPPEENQYLRDESYELIAQYLLFPCVYRENGCSKMLVPNVIESHEPCCEYRKYACPTLFYTKCKWEGARNVLFNHFGEKHPDLIIKDQSFMIDFLNSVETKLLMKVEEEIFVVKKDVDARKEIFLCTVEHVKSRETEDVYNYFVRFDSNSHNYFYKFQDRVANGEDVTKTTANFLREKLEDPPSIIVRIEVFKVTTENNAPLPTVLNEIRKNPNIDWELLSELECPICYDYMVPPVYQCITGHSICKTCRPRIQDSCPTCKEAVAKTQNFAVEKMANHIVYPCRNYKSGCTYASKAVDIEKHEESCEFGPFDCPLKAENNCQWNGSSSEIVTHVETSHGGSILRNDRIEIPFCENIQYDTTSLIICYQKVFKLNSSCIDNYCHWSVQVMERTTDNENFRFEIDIFDMTGRKNKLLVSGQVVPVTKKIDRANCVTLSLKTLGAFIRDKLCYVIRLSTD